MDVKRGQAVVIDGLFFLMICGFAAATLLWAGSVYGDKSFEAYRYIYMTDYTGGAMAVLSNLDYEYTVSIGGSSAAVKAAWLDELGSYMLGEFNETDARYKVMRGHWDTLCSQAPAPLLLTVYSEYEGTARGTQEEPLYFACGEGDRSLLKALEDEDGELNIFKYPYYSSDIMSKSCSTLRCIMDIKIYY
ncbi:MAG: hypothetical protein KAW41_04510 [Candidatus Diapherotrites archaeon]|nr:hypothetical protein [Candidatus Diapherotrites archaeon]